METLKEKYKHFVENKNINNNNNKRNNSPSNLEAIKPIIEREVYWKSGNVSWELKTNA